MPCCFPFCQRKKKEGDVSLNGNWKPASEGCDNPLEKSSTPEETIMDLKSQNESLKRIANQASRDLTVSVGFFRNWNKAGGWKKNKRCF